MRSIGRRGVALGMALILVVIMTITGYGLLRLSHANSVNVDRAIRSARAFWASEAGIVKALAISNFSQTGDTVINSNSDDPLSEASFSVTVTPVDELNGQPVSYVWSALSTGSFHGSSRRVRVLVGPYINDTLNSPGSIDIGGSAVVKDDNGVTVPSGRSTGTLSLTFQDIFGIPKSSSLADNVYPIAGDKNTESPNPIFPVSGFTWFDGNLKYTTSAFNGTGLLVVNGDLDITGGGTFEGVIWVTGKIDIRGNPFALNGAIFSESTSVGPPKDAISVGGNANISYSISGIDDAYSQAQSGSSSTHPPLGVLTWQEVSS